MKKKSHDRAPDKRNFSVALPIELIEKLEAIAGAETRSRNKQIEHFLQQSVSHYKANKMGLKPLPSLPGECKAVAS
jgi:hypothetical protein